MYSRIFRSQIQISVGLGSYEIEAPVISECTEFCVYDNLKFKTGELYEGLLNRQSLKKQQELENECFVG